MTEEGGEHQEKCKLSPTDMVFQGDLESRTEQESQTSIRTPRQVAHPPPSGFHGTQQTQLADLLGTNPEREDS